MKNRRHPALARHRGGILRCVRCGGCGAVCPSFREEREESFSARGRMALIEAVMQGRLHASRLYRGRLASCTGCLACEAACPGGVPAAEIILAAKEDAFREAGVRITERTLAFSLRMRSGALMRSFAPLAPFLLHYTKDAMRGKGQGARGKRQKAKGKRQGTRGRVAFFPGCVISLFQRDIERAAVSVLSAIGYDVIVTQGLSCCGRPLLSLGDRRAAEACAARNTAALSSLGVDAVVTACASCGLTFKKEYPTLLAPSGQEPVPVFDIHEFLAGEIDGVMCESQPVKATWHDPCHLGRGQGLAKTARAVLTNVPGVELVEMENPDQCCGFGGTMRIAQSGLSDRIGARKAAEITATRATLVVTGCPSCRIQITESLRDAGSKAEVVHTVQVIERVIFSADHPSPPPLSR